MNDILSDYLNDRVKPVPTGGRVNGVMEYDLSEDSEQSESEYDEEAETKERLSYVTRELSTYNFDDPNDDLNDSDMQYAQSIVASEVYPHLEVPGAYTNYRFDTYNKKELPIDSSREKILSLLSIYPLLIIHGKTGCGKTTQVPQYILDQCRAENKPCNIVVTQPRRIAAISIAQRVCEERNWSMGTVCGYQVGLDKNVSESVILTYMTTEVLLQKLISERNLNKYTHIIIDEVHERTKTLDFLMLIVRKYMFTNSPTVKIILMSATIEAQVFAHYFRSMVRNDPLNYMSPPVVEVNKESEFKTDIYYIGTLQHVIKKIPSFNIEEPYIHPDVYDLGVQMCCVFDHIDQKDAAGDSIIGSVLIFLPGLHEIDEMIKQLKNKTSSIEWDIIPLHSTLTRDQMAKAFIKPKKDVRKIILSTNIAESSVTVPDVTYVIDFCLTKTMVMDPVTKFSSLTLQWASKNNCRQRSGRVGRVSNGRVYRLVTEDFYENHMKENILPEIQRAPLENIILYMKLLDMNDTPKNVLALAIDPPNLKDVENCIWHLKEAGALYPTCRNELTPADGDLTFMGRVMGSLPIDIRLAKLVILGHMFSCLDEAVIMAAGCTIRNLFVNNFRDRLASYRKKLLWADGSCSDFMTLLNLYQVWLKAKRENAFRNTNEENAWCRTNYVNLKGLREWDILIKEIHSRLRKFAIEKPMTVAKSNLNSVEKITILKIIICGAFYPNYFVRSAEFGQVDAQEAVRVLAGRDPFNTVYFTNMKANQPGHIYVRQIKKLLDAEKNINVQIGFDKQSSKVYVEYKNTKQLEHITVDGQQYVTEIPQKIVMEVYEAVRKRQLSVRFPLQIFPNEVAWDFAESAEAKHKLESSASRDTLNCFSDMNYCPLPTLDMAYMTVLVTDSVDPGHFYCQNWNDETKIILDRIYQTLNGPGVVLEPNEGKVSVNNKLYAAAYISDNKFYRCRVLYVSPGQPDIAQVRFIDYGNVQKVYVNRLFLLPNIEICNIDPVAICCGLSEIKPSANHNPTGAWSANVIHLFKTKTAGFLLNAKIYSVVSDVVLLELYHKNHTKNPISLNQWLINEGFADKCVESYLSRVDHEKRLQVLNSENPVSATKMLTASITSYTDFEEPELRDARDVIELKGPHSPLEMRVFGLVQASWQSTVNVEPDSVNTVLLDDTPEEPLARLLVAGSVMQSATTNKINISQTTLMPNIPGLPMLMTLLFCPQMEPKPTPDGSRIASILCGLGHKEYSHRSNYPGHDISLVLDVDFNEEIITKINELRLFMSQGVRLMKNIYYEVSTPEELINVQTHLKQRIFSLLHMKKTRVEPVKVKYANVWNRSECEIDLEILQMDAAEEEQPIWPLLWFLKLNQGNAAKLPINTNLDELSRIAKRLIPEKEINCLLCRSNVLRTVEEVRVHVFRVQHQANVANYRKLC